MSARLLVVDDNLLWLRSIQRAARRSGVDVATAPGTSAALDLAADDSFDLVVLDYALEETTGTELRDDLEPLQPGATFFLVSGALPFAALADAARHGFAAVHSKPIAPESLFAAAEEHAATSAPTPGWTPDAIFVELSELIDRAQTLPADDGAFVAFVCAARRRVAHWLALARQAPVSGSGADPWLDAVEMDVHAGLAKTLRRGFDELRILERQLEQRRALAEEVRPAVVSVLEEIRVCSVAWLRQGVTTR